MATKMSRNDLLLPLIEQLIMQLLKLTLLLTNVHNFSFYTIFLFGKMVLKYEEITSVAMQGFWFLIFKICLKNDFRLKINGTFGWWKFVYSCSADLNFLNLDLKIIYKKSIYFCLKIE